MKKNLDITKPHYSKYYLASPLFGPSLYRGITVHYYSEHLKSIVLIKHDFGFSLLYSTNFKITDTNSDTRKTQTRKKNILFKNLNTKEILLLIDQLPVESL